MKKGINMNTITIDNKLYNEAILYAGKKRMSVAGLFESAVRNFMDLHPIKSKQSVLDSVEYKRALEAMDEFVADEQTVSVPVDEDGRDARRVIGTGTLIHQIFKPLYGDEEFETYIDRTEYE